MSVPPGGRVIAVAEDTDLLREIGQRVRALRTDRGFTQRQLAASVGLSRASITNIEAGRQGDIGVLLASRLATVLGVALADLTGPSSVRFPWLELARRVTAAEREHRDKAGKCWAEHDYMGAVRWANFADGLDLARHLHLDVVGGGGS